MYLNKRNTKESFKFWDYCSPISKVLTVLSYLWGKDQLISVIDIVKKTTS